MRTFAQKPKAAQQTQSLKPARPSRAFASQSREVSSILHLKRIIGNQAEQRVLLANGQAREDSAISSVSPRFVHDFSQIPVHGNAYTDIQPKLRVNYPGDKYEQEADQVGRMPELQLQLASSCGGGGPRCQTKQPGYKHESLQPKRIGTSVNAPQSPNLSPEFNFRMLALSKTRWSKHEDKSEILGSACHCRQI